MISAVKTRGNVKHKHNVDRFLDNFCITQNLSIGTTNVGVVTAMLIGTFSFRLNEFSEQITAEVILRSILDVL